MTDPLEERVVASELVHRGRYMEFRVDTIERADGSRGTRDVVGHPGAVAVLALDDDDRLLLVRQWRVPAGQALLEIPAGTLDVHDGVTEDPDVAARRELEEETGHRAATWRKLASFWTAPGFATELMHLYLATGIDRGRRGGRPAGARRGRAPGAAPRAARRGASRWSRAARSATRSRSSASCGSTACAASRRRAPNARTTRARRTPPLARRRRPRSGTGSRPTQFALANAEFVRSRPALRVVGLALVVIGLLNLLIGPDPWIWVTCLVAGTLFLTGAFAIPFSLLALRRRRNLLANLQLAFDERGIQSVGVASEADVRWAGIERITRSGPYLFVRFATGGTMLVPVAAFRPEQLEAFGRIALRNGLTLDGHRVDVPAR